MPKHFRWTFGPQFISIRVDEDGSGMLESNLKEGEALDPKEDSEYIVAIDALESFLLGLACAGAITKQNEGKFGPVISETLTRFADRY